MEMSARGDGDMRGAGGGSENSGLGVEGEGEGVRKHRTGSLILTSPGAGCVAAQVVDQRDPFEGAGRPQAVSQRVFCGCP